MATEESTPAIVLRTRDYSESDRIVTLLTRDAGKLSGIAKGAKQSRRRFERKLEVFSHVMLFFRRRPHGELVFITRAEAPPAPAFELVDDLAKIALASYAVELADGMTREGADTVAAYEILSATLGAVGRSGASVGVKQAFELAMLRWAGYELEFSRCRSCARVPGAEVASFAFVPSRGGVVCRNCRDPNNDGFLALSAASVSALARLGTAPIGECHGIDGAGADARLALSRFIAGVVDRRLRSIEFLDSIL